MKSAAWETNPPKKRNKIRYRTKNRGQVEGIGAIQPQEETTERRPHQCLSVSAERDQRMDQALLSGAQELDKKQGAETDIYEVPPEHEEELLHYAVTEHWNRSPREGVESPSLQIAQNYLDAIL
ncbi:hypothetical protein DUI87_11272 [Hirundo rustica rustica]|uniref:Uncharacterized protein n=1 Tax=Hirundo rustica rustica TaxID=333673 RepID=A0A3M0KYE7_HIRRU|nr:hypothetical protein DUI87_11272 [Hirundo rustica rustica]